MLPLLIFLTGLVCGALAAHGAETVMARRPWARPACPYCKTPYAGLQWSATLGPLFGAGRCPACGRPVRWQRAVGELLLAATWTVLVVRYGLTWRAALSGIAAVPLIMVTVTDLETRLIPNRIILPACGALAVMGTLAGTAMPGLSFRWWTVLAGGAFGFLVFWALVAGGTALFGEGALGVGDIKLAAYIGLVVGFPLIVEALVLAILFGFVGGVILVIIHRGNLRIYIPYGPFLVLGGLTTLLWGMEIAAWFLR